MKPRVIVLLLVSTLLLLLGSAFAHDPGSHDRGGLSGRVTDALTSAPIPRALIRACNEERGWGHKRSFQTLSLEDGTYSFAVLPTGRYIVWAQAAGHLPEYWQEADSLHKATAAAVDSGITTTGIDFTLGTGGSITGLVTDEADKLPVAGAIIEVHPRRSLACWNFIRSDAEGRYLVTGLEDGEYLVSAWRVGYYPQWYDSVSMRREATPVTISGHSAAAGIDFALSKPAPLPRSISGVVSDDTTGLPVENVRIMAIPLRSFNRPRRVLSDATGSFVLRGLAAGKYVLLIDARGYKGEFYDNVRSWKEALAIEVLEGQEVTGIEIKLAPQLAGAHRITGRVLDGQGQAVEGALVRMNEGVEEIAAAVTAEEGYYDLEDLPAGSYTLTASAPGYEEATPAFAQLSLGSALPVDGLTLLVRSTATGIGENPQLPEAPELGQNYPNPFNPDTRIDFTLPARGMVRLTLHDMLGREIRTLVHGEMAAGGHSAVWDGADDYGSRMASGIYLCRLEVESGSGSFTRVRRMLLLK